MIEILIEEKNGKITLRNSVESKEDILVKQMIIFSPKPGPGKPILISRTMAPGNTCIVDISKTLIELVGDKNQGLISIDLILEPMPENQPSSPSFRVTVLNNSIDDIVPE